MSASIPNMPDTSPDHLVAAKKKRNIILASTISGVVVLIVIAVLVYLFVFRPRVYYGNHIMITTLQTPGKCYDQSSYTYISNNKTLTLKKSFNCPPLSPIPKPPKQQPIYLLPNNAQGRYTLNARSLSNNTPAGCGLDTQMSCMLVTPQLGRSGLIHENQLFMVWEPMNNTYLYQIPNCEGLNTSSCTDSSITVDTCSYNNSENKCQPKPNISKLIFRTIPNDFKNKINDPKNNPYLQGFLFSFATKKTLDSQGKQPNNMLMINTNYIMKSKLSGNFVQFNIMSNNIRLISSNEEDKIDDTFNWQILKA